LAAESGAQKNSFEQESEKEDENMGDLQSPQYVKRTAHMFNSKHSRQVITNTVSSNIFCFCS